MAINLLSVLAGGLQGAGEGVSALTALGQARNKMLEQQREFNLEQAIRERQTAVEERRYPEQRRMQYIQDLGRQGINVPVDASDAELDEIARQAGSITDTDRPQQIGNTRGSFMPPRLQYQYRTTDTTTHRDPADQRAAILRALTQQLNVHRQNIQNITSSREYQQAVAMAGGQDGQMARSLFAHGNPVMATQLNDSFKHSRALEDALSTLTNQVVSGDWQSALGDGSTSVSSSTSGSGPSPLTTPGAPPAQGQAPITPGNGALPLAPRAPTPQAAAVGSRIILPPRP